MNLSTEENLMYTVMNAIYDSGIPISFKGSMVLRACLMETGYSEDIRHTVDIDANWNDNESPTGERMVESLQKALSQKGLDLNVSLYRMYGQGRSAGFELSDRDSGEVYFTMDIDVNRPVPPTKIYEVAGVRFCGVAPIQMIADKVAAVSTDRVFRRIKDVIDLYYFSQVFPFDRASVLETLNNSGKELGSFHCFMHRREELRHAYEKFRFSGNISKPPFRVVLETVDDYIRDVLPRNKDRGFGR